MRVRKKFIIDYIKFLKIRNVFSINYKTEFEFVSLKENEDITTQMEIFFSIRKQFMFVSEEQNAIRATSLP